MFFFKSEKKRKIRILEHWSHSKSVLSGVDLQTLAELSSLPNTENPISFKLLHGVSYC